jgi:hypothetical protein
MVGVLVLGINCVGNSNRVVVSVEPVGTILVGEGRRVVAELTTSIVLVESNVGIPDVPLPAKPQAVKINPVVMIKGRVNIPVANDLRIANYISRAQ